MYSRIYISHSKYNKMIIKEQDLLVFHDNVTHFVEEKLENNCQK
jgi:hypothetical protein